MEEQILKWSHQIVPWLLTHGVKILIIIIIALVLNHFAQRVITRGVRSAIKSSEVSDPGAEAKREDTLIRIFTGVAKILILLMGVLMILQELGMMIGPILAGAGIAGLAFGFGGQYLIRDIISGLFIILENQYRIGDVVSFDGTGGLVEDISLRMTTIRDLDGTVHHIPHGEIKKVSNLSKFFSRVNLDVGVAYNTNLDHAISVINRVGNELAADEKWKAFIIQPPQFLRVDALADSSIIIKIVGDTQPIKQWDVSGELRKRLKEAFEKEGIVIPFPQRRIHITPPAPDKEEEVAAEAK